MCRITRTAKLILLGLAIGFTNGQGILENNSENTCIVTEGNSGQPHPCEFPFKLLGKIYFGCTTDEDDAGQHWCSTKVDPNTYEHVAGNGHWGHCSAANIHCPDSSTFELSNVIALEAEATIKNDTIVNSNRGDLDQLSCPCKSFRECKWSANMYNFILRLDARHPTRKRLISFIKARTCDQDRSLSVFCCSDGKSPDTVFPNAAANPTTTTTPRTRIHSSNPRDLGTWKPDGGDQRECGLRTVKSNIVGGEDTKLGEFPYMALLGFEIKGDVFYTCGGSVINKWYILTAAHCTHTFPVEILLGEHTVGPNPDCIEPLRKKTCVAPIFKRGIDKVIVHEQYDPKSVGGPFDIALIRVTEMIPMFTDDAAKSSVLPVCLPWKENAPGRVLRKDDELVVTGWGKTTNRAKISLENYRKFRAATRIMKKLTVPAISRSACENEPTFDALDSSLQLCAGGIPGQDSCNGDSGGPLVYRIGPDEPWHQVGLVSFGTKTCGIGLPGVYTRITAYLPWINSKLEP